MNWRIIENIATLAAVTAIVLGVWAMGGGGWSFWGMALLINMNTQT